MYNNQRSKGRDRSPHPEGRSERQKPNCERSKKADKGNHLKCIEIRDCSMSTSLAMEMNQVHHVRLRNSSSNDDAGQVLARYLLSPQGRISKLEIIDDKTFSVRQIHRLLLGYSLMLESRTVALKALVLNEIEVNKECRTGTRNGKSIVLAPTMNDGLTDPYLERVDTTKAREDITSHISRPKLHYQVSGGRQPSLDESWYI